MPFRTVTFVVIASILCFVGTALAADLGGLKIKIAVLSDMSGPLSDLTGPGSVIAAQLAIDDFKLQHTNVNVELVSADHQNKADVGAVIARKWLDVEGVDVILDVPNSSVALAVNEVVRGKNKVLVVSGGGTSDLTSEKCSPNTIHWTYDTWSLANGIGKASVKAGLNNWFFLTADYAFGLALERDTAAAVTGSGGKVLGVVRHPFGTSDFSSFLLQAQASKAQVIALANSGGDTINAIKQAREFGIIEGGQSLVAILLFMHDVRSVGLDAAKGMLLTEPWYWDINDGSRAFARRFAERGPKKLYPISFQAGVYSGVTHYLKIAAARGDVKDGAGVVADMKKMTTDDPLFGKGLIRPDGRKIHPMYIFKVKTPQQSKNEWDLYDLTSTIPSDEAFRPMRDGTCALVSKN
jgi:branched-chain amino acid transport system substrate-binding protein